LSPAGAIRPETRRVSRKRPRRSKLLSELGFNAALLEDVHVFSSHFYTKFYEEPIGRTQASKVRLPQISNLLVSLL
jgi:hypothetical protein